MDNPLSDLKLDAWYKILIVIGAILLIASLTVSLAVDNLKFHNFDNVFL
jgi:hypothetical protein